MKVEQLKDKLIKNLGENRELKAEISKKKSEQAKFYHQIMFFLVKVEEFMGDDMPSNLKKESEAIVEVCFQFNMKQIEEKFPKLQSNNVPGEQIEGQSK